MTEAQDHDLGGRPLKFQTVAELRQKIQDYFDACDPHVTTRRVKTGVNSKGLAIWDEREELTDQQPYTVMGLARTLKTTRETVLDYESGTHDDKDDTDPQGERFSDIVKDAKARINEDVERRLLSGIATTGAIFWLKNNAGYRDQTHIDHTTKDKPMPLLAGLAPNKLEVDDAAAGPDDRADEDQ